MKYYETSFIFLRIIKKQTPLIRGQDMDVKKQLGPMALGSRLKRLTIRMNKDISRIYRELGMEFEARWFPVAYLLRQRSPLSITEIAALDRDAVPDIVWDEAIAGHTSPTTFGGKNQKVVPSETINDYKADVSGLSTFDASTDPVDLNADQSGVTVGTTNALGTTAKADVNAEADQALIDYDSGGGVAKENSLAGLQSNNRFVTVLPSPAYIPDSTSSNIYKIIVNLYSTEGALQDPDNNEIALDLNTIGDVGKNDLLYKEYALNNNKKVRYLEINK